MPKKWPKRGDHVYTSYDIVHCMLSTEPLTKARNHPTTFSTLTLRGLRVSAYVGWSEAERLSPQPIDIDICIQFAEPPPACRSDELAHTVCYAELSNIIKTCAANQQFKLIERMAYKLLREIKIRLPAGSLGWIRITKLQIPIPDVHGNASFSYGDFIPEGV